MKPGRWLLLLLFLSGLQAAGGKIAGRVVEAGTGEPLPAASVYIPELRRGTATDADGFYYLLNLPPGIYTVRAEYLGHRPVEKRRVRVERNRTTFLDFALPVQEIATEPVVVTATPPPVQPDLTWKEVTVHQKQLEALPVQDAQEVLLQQGGVTEGPGGELHIRGGRAGEVLYVLDGMPVRNPLTGEFHGILDRTVLADLSLQVGTFSAEYGNALSGVVEVSTAEPRDRTAYLLEYESATLVPSPYRRPDMLGPGFDAHRDSLGRSLFHTQHLKDWRDVPFLGTLRARWEGPIRARSLYGMLAFVYGNRESYLPFGYRMQRAGTGRLFYRQGGYRVSATVERGWTESQDYSHAWKYRWDHYPVRRVHFDLASLRFTHLVSPRFFYSLVLGTYAEVETTAVPGKAPEAYEDPVLDACTEFFVDGDEPTYRRSRSRTYTARGDLTYQYGHHEWKLGGEVQLHRLFLESYERLFVVAGFSGPRVHQRFERRPREAALYLRDKIEYPNLVLNLGVRLDYADPRARMWQDPEDPHSPLVWAPARFQVSPRLGFAYPLSEDAVLHFAYGHFFQRPPYEAAYKNPQFLNPDRLPPQLGILGNPALKPQKTVAYELGLALGLAPEYTLDLTLYARDIWDLLSTHLYRAFPYEYTLYVNADFATVRGVDLTLRRRFHRGLGFQVSYTLQVARGNRSFPLQGFYDAYTGQPEAIREYYLDFDRRHVLSVVLDARGPLGLRMGARFRYATGLPYTPYAPPGVVVEENSARMPATLSLDFRLSRAVHLRGQRLEAYLELRNATNHRNVRFVYPRTGDPWDPGQYGGVGVCTEDYAKNPAHLGPPRTLSLGLRLAR